MSITFSVLDLMPTLPMLMDTFMFAVSGGSYGTNPIDWWV